MCSFVPFTIKVAVWQKFERLHLLLTEQCVMLHLLG